MPINTGELMNVVATIAENNDLRVTMKESLKGGLITGASATVGGIFLGPFGLAIGGMLGGLSAAMMSKNKFKSLSQIIMYDMTPDQQERLTLSITTVLRELRMEDAITLAPLLLLSEPAAQAAVLRTLITFVTDDMRLQIAE